MPADAPAPEPLEYNPVFERLVDNEDGEGKVVGLIAYGIYKVSKRQWVTEFRQSNGEKPSEDHMRIFAATQTEVSLDGYKAQAEQLLAAYAEAVLAEAKPKITKDAVQGLFGSSVLSSLLASFIFSIVLLALAFVAALMGYGLPVQITIPKVG